MEKLARILLEAASYQYLGGSLVRGCEVDLYSRIILNVCVRTQAVVRDLIRFGHRD